MCGASTATPPAEANLRPADRETIKFARAVLNRPYKFTIAFLVVNLFVFLLMWESSGLTFSVLREGFPEAVLIAYGAKLNYLIDPPNHQWWRFITPMFVHIDVLHLLMNMFSLLILGPFVEKLYGSAKFVVFWVVSGIAGSVGAYLALRPSLATGVLGSFLFKSVDAPSAGASGALFGLVGVLFVFGIKFRRELPEGFKRVFGTGLLPIILINLFIGFVGRTFIGNSAHLSGLFAGALLALVVDYRRPGARLTITTLWRALQILCLAVIALGGLEVVRNFRLPEVIHTTQNAHRLTFLNYVETMNKVQEKVSAVIHNHDLNDTAALTQKAMQTPAPDPRANELKTQLVVILSKLTEAATKASPAAENPSARPPEPDQKLVDEFQQWRKEYEEWLKDAAKTYTATVRID